MYEFPVKTCENCHRELKVDDKTDIVEEEGFSTIGYCPHCFVGYEMVKVQDADIPIKVS